MYSRIIPGRLNRRRGTPVSTGFNGNFASLFPASDILLITQSDVGVTSSGGLVSNWTDGAAAPHNFTAVLTRRPSLTAGLNSNPGLLFDGVNNGLTSTLALPAPGTVPYRIGIVFRQITWISGGYVSGDNNGVAGTVYSSAVSPQLRMYNGSATTAVGTPALGTWEATEAYFSNSVADSFRRGSTAASTGVSAGNAVGSSLMLGNGGAFATPTNIEVLHYVILTGASATTMPATWRAAVTTKYGATVNV